MRFYPDLNALEAGISDSLCSCQHSERVEYVQALVLHCPWGGQGYRVRVGVRVRVRVGVRVGVDVRVGVGVTVMVTVGVRVRVGEG